MSHASNVRRGLILFTAWAMCLVSTGCSYSSRTDSTRITITNVSSLWLKVDFFVASRTQIDPEQPISLLRGETIQVRPGQTATYAIAKNRKYTKVKHPIVHIRVRPVTPSWEYVETEYWMELLTYPPVTIVATGTEDRVEFMTGDGALAMIPASKISGGAFVYKTLGDIPTESRVFETGAAEQDRRAQIEDSDVP